MIVILSAGVANGQQATSSVSDSNDAAIQQRAAAHMRRVRGADNPAAIPSGIKLETFVRQASRQLVTDAGRDQLKAALQFSQEDWNLLTTVVQRDRSAVEEIERSDQQRVTDLCRRASEGGIEPAAFGRLLTEAEDLKENALAAHYRKALVEQLSANGQRALLSYIDSSVIESMTYGRINFEGLLAEFPELARDIANRGANEEAISPPEESSDGTFKGFTSGSEHQ